MLQFGGNLKPYLLSIIISLICLKHDLIYLDQIIAPCLLNALFDV